MVEKFTKYKKYILSIVSLIMLSTLSFGINHLMKSKNNEPIPEVKLREVNKTKAFAIMVQNGDIYEEYTGENDTWPGDNYKFKEAKCIDNNGASIENVVTFTDGKATLTTDKTIYCTLYFDKSLLGKLRENDPNKVLSSEEVGGMYRYQGVGTEEGIDDTHKLVDNNYICFGTNDLNKCNCKTEENCDKYMYRIIGITQNNELYLIKK